MLGTKYFEWFSFPRGIDKDRNDVLKLFLTIPKTTLLLVKEKLNKESDLIEDDRDLKEFIQASSQVGYVF